MGEIEIIRIPVAAPEREALLEALRAARRDGYLAPPACTGLEIADSDSGIVCVIRWASPEAHRRAAESPDAGALFGAVGQLASGAPSIEALPLAQAGGRLADQVALVTGGAKGIGRAVVDRFVAEGARVAVVDIDEAALAEVRAAHGDRVLCLALDLRTADGNRTAVKQTIAAFGALDCYVANAGMFDGFLDFAATSLDRLDAGFTALFDVNVRAVLLGARAALPHLAARRGSIIVTLSNAAHYPDGGGVLYVASKHAGLGIVRQLAHELAPTVRVNAVSPGATRTTIGIPEGLGGPLDQTTPEMAEIIGGLVPIGFQSRPEDHADAYVLLAARGESRAMTGSVIRSDGGLEVRGLRRTRGGDALAASMKEETDAL